MNVISRYGNMTLRNFQNQQLFPYHLVCKDNQNRMVIIGSDRPIQRHPNESYIQIHKEEKLHISKVMMKTMIRPNKMPTRQDQYTLMAYRYKVIDPATVNEQKIIEVYRVTRR